MGSFVRLGLTALLSLFTITACNAKAEPTVALPEPTVDTQKASTPGKQTAIFAGGGGAVGTVIGAIAGGGIGFLLGPAIGAAGGAAVQMVRGPEPVRIPAESLMLFTVQSPVHIEVPY